jgi:hypothetical protein
MCWNKLTACSTTTSKRNISEEQQHCVVDGYRNGRGKHKSERKKREKVRRRILWVRQQAIIYYINSPRK